jgi:hypothetical protein
VASEDIYKAQQQAPGQEQPSNSSSQDSSKGPDVTDVDFEEVK